MIIKLKTNIYDGYSPECMIRMNERVFKFGQMRPLAEKWATYLQFRITNSKKRIKYINSTYTQYILKTYLSVFEYINDILGFVHVKCLNENKYMLTGIRYSSLKY